MSNPQSKSQSKSKPRSQRKSTPKRNPSPKPPPRPPPPPSGLAHTPYSIPQLLGQFHKLLPARVLAGWLAASPRAFYQRAFTPLIVLWDCIFPRLFFQHTLSQVLTDARDGGADRLSPRGKRLSRQLRSSATAAYSEARQRLPLEVFFQTLRRSAQQIASWAKGVDWKGWRVVLVDGSTLRLRPHGDIAEVFPPHRPGNCKKAPYWCLVRVVVGFCLGTGAVVDCALGSLKASEQALCAMLLSGGDWAKTLLIGDRNFGVYSVVLSAQAASAQSLVRLTKLRAAKLARSVKARLVAGLDIPLVWRPSAHDQCPEGLDPKPVAGRLLALRVRRPGFPPLMLYLFTTLTEAQTYPAADLAQL